jgi:hypothetical protein
VALPTGLPVASVFALTAGVTTVTALAAHLVCPRRRGSFRRAHPATEEYQPWEPYCRHPTMPEPRAIGGVSLRAGAFVLSGVALSTVLFSALSTFVIFRDSAVPVLFAAASSIPVGINSFLVLSYALGFLTSYVFFYRGGLDRIRRLFGDDG